MSYITLTLLKPLNSEGIGPVSRLELKSKTLRFLNEPNCFGIVPKSRLWSKYLQTHRKRKIRGAGRLTSENKLKLQIKIAYSSCKKLSRPSAGAMNPLRDEFDSFLKDEVKSPKRKQKIPAGDFDLLGKVQSWHLLAKCEPNLLTTGYI